MAAPTWRPGEQPGSPNPSTADAGQSQFTPEPHWMPPSTKPPTSDENSGQTMSASRNKGQRGRAMRALHAQNNDVHTMGD